MLKEDTFEDIFKAFEDNEIKLDQISTYSGVNLNNIKKWHAKYKKILITDLEMLLGNIGAYFQMRKKKVLLK